MRAQDPRPTREQEALAEMAATRVAPASAWIASLVFLALTLSGVTLEVASLRRGSPFLGGLETFPRPAELLERWQGEGALAANRQLRTALAALEDRTGRESALSRLLRPRAQRWLASRLGYGNSQVIVGPSGRLYFQTAFDYLTGRSFLEPRQFARRQRPGARYPAVEPDPVPGLLFLRDELAGRGIQLVFFPVPVKEQIEPEGLSRRALDPGLLPENPSYRTLVARLESAGLPVFDALAELRAAALSGETVYLANDTHWNPRGVEIAARGLAEFLRRRVTLPPLPGAGFVRQPARLDFEGDLKRLLGLGELVSPFADESVEGLQLFAADGRPHAPLEVPSDILFLGDSYAVVYTSQPGLQSGAGIAEQLAFHLDRPVRRLAKAGANALADRAIWLRTDPALLDGTRVVIYEVTARAFTAIDWQSATIHRPKRRPS